jgi:hypothetical protein
MELNKRKFLIFITFSSLFVHKLIIADQFSLIASFSFDAWDLNERYQSIQKGIFQKSLLRIGILSLVVVGIYHFLKVKVLIEKPYITVFIFMNLWMLGHSLVAFSSGGFGFSELHGSKGILVWLGCSMIFVGMHPKSWGYAKGLLWKFTLISSVLILYRILFYYPGFSYKKQTQIFFMHYLPLLLWTAPFFIYELRNKKVELKTKLLTFFPFSILGVSILLSSARSWLIILFIHIILMMYLFKKNGKQVIITIFIMALVLILISMEDKVSPLIQYMVSNWDEDTRSGQYSQLLAQVSPLDIIFGTGPRGFWLWNGVPYQFIDGAFTLLIFNGGIPLLASYFSLYFLPAIKVLNHKSLNVNVSNSPAIMMFFWFLVMLGISTFTAPGITYDHAIISLFAGRSYYLMKIGK